MQQIVRYQVVLRAVFILGVFLASCSMYIRAQDTLPSFSVTTRGNNKILVSWTNNYKKVSQISIQRSSDSTRNFKTILTVPDPNVPQNGFVDSKAATSFMFYRLFVVLDSGKYVFTNSKRPFWDTSKVAVVKPPPEKIADNNNRDNNGKQRVVIADNVDRKSVEKIQEKLEPKVEEKPKPPEPEKFFFVKKRDSLLAQIPEKDFKKFRDSLVNRTKDTLVFKSVDTVLIKPFVPKEVYRPSIYVYTAKDGNVSINLPEARNTQYSIKFFEENNLLLFEIKQVKEPSLILDKANFLHAGWFRFELYQDGQLKEKNKFFIPKDF